MVLIFLLLRHAHASFRHILWVSFCIFCCFDTSLTFKMLLWVFGCQRHRFCPPVAQTARIKFQRTNVTGSGWPRQTATSSPEARSQTCTSPVVDPQITYFESGEKVPWRQVFVVFSWLKYVWETFPSNASRHIRKFWFEFISTLFESGENCMEHHSLCEESLSNKKEVNAPPE